MKNDFLIPIAFCSIVIGGIVIVWFSLTFDLPEKEKEFVLPEEKSVVEIKVEELEIRVEELEKEFLWK